MTLLADRYELDAPLDTRARTYQARDTHTDTLVIVKELTLGRLTDWKELELFEREAAALRVLDHPMIPKLLDAFRGPADSPPAFYLAIEHVEGEPLDALLERVGRLSAARVEAILRQVFQALEYLHSFSPPVLHRDIKPGNLIERPDGSIALVDFGAVQIDSYGTTGGSTVVGTSGYMAPEQLIGKAVPASDLYALGATAIHLLCGIPPANLMLRRMKLQWRDKANAPGSLTELIDRLVEPLPAHRPTSASVARAALGGALALSPRDADEVRLDRRTAWPPRLPSGGSRARRAPPIDAAIAVRAKPEGSKITLQRSADELRIVQPGASGLVGKILWGVGMVPVAAIGIGLAMWWPLVGGSKAAICSVGTVLAMILVLLVMLANLITQGRQGTTTVLTRNRWKVVPDDRSIPAASGSLDAVTGVRRSGSVYLQLDTEAWGELVAYDLAPAEQDWLHDQITDFVLQQRRAQLGADEEE